MKRFLPTFFTVCLFTATPFSEAPTRLISFAQDDDATRQKRDVSNANDFEIYVDKQARWLVDLRLGVVSAWELERDVPLWSRDGVVFRVAQRPTDAISDLYVATKAKPRPTREIFNRVYFFVNDVLIALDPRAQGRLVWKRNAADFAPFFAVSNNAPLLQLADDVAPSFIPQIYPTFNDRLLIQARRGQEIKSFTIDAASGEFRLALPNETR